MHCGVPVGCFPCDAFVPIVSAFSALVTSVHLGSVEGIVHWETWKRCKLFLLGRHIMIFCAPHYDYTIWLLPFENSVLQCISPTQTAADSIFAPYLVVWWILWKWTHGSTLAVLQDAHILSAFIINSWSETLPINLDFNIAVVKNRRRSDFLLMPNNLRSSYLGKEYSL